MKNTTLGSIAHNCMVIFSATICDLRPIMTKGTQTISIFRRLRIRVRGIIRRLCENFGLAHYSRPARDDLDRKLQKYLPESGFFVEAGAHDGYSDSNTYYLERIKGWSGVLVEPMLGNYRACVAQRPNSIAFHCALVDPSYSTGTIDIHFCDRMSWVEGALDLDEAARRASAWKTAEPAMFRVPARTLASILDEVGSPRIDFLSLDVEGSEPQALRGLDLARHRPIWILVECRTPEMRIAVCDLLTGYELVATLSHHDFLYRDAR